MRTLALAPSRPLPRVYKHPMGAYILLPLQNTRLITQYLRGCWIQEGTPYTPRRSTTVESEMDFARSVLIQQDLRSRIAPGGLSLFALDNCGNVAVLKVALGQARILRTMMSEVISASIQRHSNAPTTVMLHAAFRRMNHASFEWVLRDVQNDFAGQQWTPLQCVWQIPSELTRLRVFPDDSTRNRTTRIARSY